MKELMEFADKIKDKELKGKVIEILKHPALSHKGIKIKPVKYEDSPGSINWHHVKTGGLIEHTYSVVKNCIEIAENLKKVYKHEIDMDVLIASALVHDIGKLWTFQRGASGTWEPTEIFLDHSFLGVSELYSRGFPETILHCVASHFGENGPTPPRTMEAILLHMVDNMDATLGAMSKENLLHLMG
ncbi:MAG: HD domain-containing protein, partial [Nanoarchaeota archaeon]